jgi:rubrerythrin
MTQDTKPAGMKIFPRNLTARAAYVVRGNPVVSRPESGADNSHPGLEFDMRSLDRGFFPGLLFNFDFGVGARLVDVQKPWLDSAAQDLRSSLRDGETEYFLWYLFGRFGDQPDTWVFANLYGLDGYEVMRKVHDLESGPLVVCVGRHPDKLDLDKMKEWVAEVMKLVKLTQLLQANDTTKAGEGMKPIFQAFRDGKRNIQFAVFVAERSRYLDGDGVIDLDTAARGTLTQSLCSPWQWDFADCGCYYWAASRPDIVTSADGKTKGLNYLRLRGRDETDGAVPNFDDTKWADWMDDRRIMSQPLMISAWETLPVVVDDREATHYKRDKVTSVEALWERDKIIKQLTYLASVEHALCVCYLYAYYSVNAPDETSELFPVAKEVRDVAIDEMRHFRWVNEALVMLGAQPEFSRAVKLSNLPADSPLRPQNIDLVLDGLTPEALQRFIDVEQPSAVYGRDQIAGLYTHILLSLEDLHDGLEEEVRERVMELIKLIIDEGTDHYQRALLIKQRLDGWGRRYLLFEGEPDPQDANSELGKLQILGDHYYRVVLDTLRLAFDQAPDARGALLKQAQRVMHNLDEVGQLLASQRKGLLFTLPKSPVTGAALPDAISDVLATPIASLLADLKTSGSDSVTEVAWNHELTAYDLLRFYRRIYKPVGARKKK